MNFQSVLNKCYRKLSRFLLRKRLRNTNFSIITNTCIGGVIYHELGLQFLSPTINLWMEDKDFYKFATHLKEYLVKDLVFIDGIDLTPTAYLGDILIHFNHYSSNIEAKQKWEERRARINWDNLFFICSDRTPNTSAITYEEMKSLETIKCRGKVVFTNRVYEDLDYLLPLTKDVGCDYVNVYMEDKTAVLGRWRWEKSFNYVCWLNTGKLKK